MYFAYGEQALSYLRKKDKRLCEVIDRIGHIDRTVDPDLFSSVVHHIIGQQISTKAQATIWQRMQDALGTVNAEAILAAGVPSLQALGMTFRKAAYITDFAERVHTGAFDLDAVAHMSDEAAIRHNIRTAASRATVKCHRYVSSFRNLFSCFAHALHNPTQRPSKASASS